MHVADETSTTIGAWRLATLPLAVTLGLAGVAIEARVRGPPVPAASTQPTWQRREERVLRELDASGKAEAQAQDTKQAPR